MSELRENKDFSSLSSPHQSISPSAPASRWWPIVAAVPALLLALVLASFPARHSEVWQHLAAGRGLVNGVYHLGSDPFTYTNAGASWVNHSWLYDLVLYGLHSAIGSQLVVLNALLATATAWLMLLACGWPRALTTSLLSLALGLVCLGEHLLLMPGMVSYLLLAFTVWWLQRSDDEPSHWTLRGQAPLLVAMALWANSDEWSLLGPLTVGLYWLGSLLRPRAYPRMPWYVPAAALAACVINPHHIRAFRLPAALFDVPTGTTVDKVMAMSWPDLPVPLVAYLLLAVLSLLALLAGRSWRSAPLAAVWVVLLGLSLYRPATIPFFAIVASVVLAIHWQAARSQSGEDVQRQRRPWLEPAMASATLWVLVGLACPGWLQGQAQPRSWLLRPDPSMKELAEQLAQWHEQGKLGEQARSFALSPDAAHYIEWFCPQEQVFLDGRSGFYHSEVVREFRELSSALADEKAPAAAPEQWRRALTQLRDWGCTHLVIADPDDRRVGAALRNLWHLPDEFTLVELKGRAALFTLQQPRSDLATLPLPPLDLQQRAWDTRRAVQAPPNGLRAEPQPRRWWEVWQWAHADNELDRDEAAALILHFEALRKATFERDRAIALAQVVAVPLAAAGPHNAGVPDVTGFMPLDTLLATGQALASKGDSRWDVFALQQLAELRENSDQGPAGSLFLALRAARTALRDQPDDALAHSRLGRAYYFLQRQTLERGVHDEFPLLEQLRRVQTVVALKRAVRLRPDATAPHELLTDVFLDARAYDLALPHLQEQVRLEQAAGPAANESADEFAARIERLRQAEQQLGKQVRDLLNLADTQSFGLGVYSKARYAENSGLPGYALEQLLRSNYVEFGREGATLELFLLLHAGRTEDFRNLVEPKQEEALGTFSYHWMQTLLAAADGNYDQADEELELLVNWSIADREGTGQPTNRSTAVLDGVQVLLCSTNNPWQWLWQARSSGHVFPQPSPPEVRRETDLHCVRGLLALEAGEIEPARRALRQSLVLWNGNQGAPRLARHYLRLTDPE